MKSTTTNNKRFQQPRFVPAMPSPATTVEEQKQHFDVFWNEIRNQVHRELEQRNGQGKPCPTDITGALLPGAQNIVMGIACANSGIIRMQAVETFSKGLTEFTEFSYSKSA